MHSSRFALAAALAAFHVPAAAQSVTLDSATTEAGGADTTATTTETTVDVPTPGSAEDAHHAQSDEIVVTGIRKKTSDVIGGISVLDAGDLPALRESPKLFARKFDVDHDTEVLDRIDSDLLREHRPASL